jgi:hypothetical protein
MVKNETLKEVKEFNHTLAKPYSGEDHLLMCLDSQRASLYKEGFGYIPKKGKATFDNHKTSFVRTMTGIARVASKLIFKDFRYENLYLIDFNASDTQLLTCLFTKSSMGWLWHRRLGHCDRTT